MVLWLIRFSMFFRHVKSLNLGKCNDIDESFGVSLGVACILHHLVYNWCGINYLEGLFCEL